MAIQQDPQTILDANGDPSVLTTEITLATANGGIYTYQTTKDIYVTEVNQSFTSQTVNNIVNNPGGNLDGEIQFLNGSTFGADKDFRYNDITDTLTLGGGLQTNLLDVTRSANLGSVANIRITGGIPGQVLTTDGTGSLSWSIPAGTYGDSNVAAFLTTYNGNIDSYKVQTSVLNVIGLATLSTAVVNGNITAGNAALGNMVTANYFSGNGSMLSALNGANVIGQVPSAALAGTVTTAAQPNITSVGTLTGLTSSGDITTTGNVTATGNIVGGNLTTTGIVSSAGVVSTGNVSGTNIVASGNISGVNFAASGNAVVTGNIQANAAFVGNALLSRTGPLTLTSTGASDITLTTGGNVVLSTPTHINNVADPLNAQDAATKAYVDAVAQGLKPKAAVQCATPGDINLVSSPATIDGYTLVSGDRILVKSQTNPAQNGIYTFTAAGAMLTRSTDANTAALLPDGTFAFVEDGVTYAACGFVLTQTIATLGIDPVVFTQFAQAATYTAGLGLSQSGTQFSITPTAVVAGGYGNATHVAEFTVSSTGQLTSASATAVIANAETLAGTTLKSTVVNSSLTSVGTLGTLSVSGNANVGNIGATTGVFTTVAGSLTTAAQPNITSVGTLTTLDVTGTVTGGNIATGGNVVATGNISGSNLSTTGAVTATGTITGGNLATAGNITATGNIQGGNIAASGGTFTYVSGDGANLSAITGANVTGAVAFATTANAVAGANVSGEVGFAAVANSVAGANVSGQVGFAAVANSVAGANVSGQVLFAGTANSVSGANVSGQVGNALVAGTVYTAAQPNITSVGTLTSLAVTGAVTAASFTGTHAGEAGNLSNIQGANVTGNVTSAVTANFANFAGNVTEAAQPNITSVGTLTGLAVSGTTNLGAVGNVTITGGTNGQVLQTNGSGALAWTTISTSGVSNGTSNVSIPGTNGNVNTSVGGVANVFVVTSTGANVAGTFNATGNAVIGGNLTVTGNLVGNITGANNSNFAGSVTTNAQPNITSVGTLTSLTVSGNVDASNVNAAGGVFTYVKGDGANLSAITGANVTGTVPSATVAASANAVAGSNVTGAVAFATTANAVAGANVSGAVAFATTANAVAGVNVSGQVANALVAGTVYTAAQPNITSVGTLTDLAVTGNVDAGNVNATGGVFTYVKGDGANLSAITGANVSGAVAFATTANAVAGANVSGQVSYAAVANSVAGSNIVGQVANAAIAGTVYTAAQPNITSVGTLTSLAVSGNTTTGNISATGGVFTYVSGDGANLTAIAGANVTGQVGFAAVANSVSGANVTSQVANSLVAGTVYTAAQPNITSVGTLSSLAVTANVTAANFVGNLVGGTATGTTATFTGAVTGDTLSSTGNTAVGGNLSVSYDASIAGNASVTGNVIATGDVQANGAFIGNALTTRTGPLTLTASGTNNIVLATGTGNIVLSPSAHITNLTDPVNAQDAATKVYVDALAQGLRPKAAAQCATTGDISLSSPPAIIDDYTIATGDRVLVRAQANSAENGIYSFIGGVLVRSTDADTVADLPSGTFIFVEYGTVYGSSGLVMTSTITTLDVDPIVFAQFSTGGSYTAGAGLLLVGSQFSVDVSGVTAGSYGNGTHIPSFTVSPEGLITAAGTTAVSANASTLAGTVLNPSIITSSLTSVGTLNTLTVTGNANVGNIGAASGVFTAVTGSLVTAAQPNITSVGTLTSLAVSGNTTTGNISATGGVFTYVSGDGANLTAIAGANVTGTVPNATNAVVAASANSVAGANVTGAVALATNAVTANSVAGANVSGEVAFAAVANSVAAANVVGSVSSANFANFAGNVTVAAQANITSVGTLTGLTVSGATNLGPVGNVTITGGSTGQVLTTDGSGTLTWSTVAGGVSNGTSNVSAPTVNGNINTSVGGVANVFVVTSTGANITGTLNATGNAVIGGNLTVTGSLSGNISNANVANFAGTVTTNAQPNITSVGTLTSLDVTGNITGANLTGAHYGTGASLTDLNASNISTGTLAQARLANAAVTLGSTALTLGGTVTTVAGLTSVTSTTFVGALTGAATTAGTVTTAAQPNITSVGTLTGLTSGGVVNFTTSSNVTLGPVANVRITGGTAGQVLTTNGSNVLSWATPAVGTSIVNGTSNVNIAASNGNVTIGVAGNAAIATFTGTGSNIAGTLTVTGNITGGNLSTSGTVTASTLVSNVATGTAPLTVTSTTQVANLNAATAGTVITAAQPNITSVGTLTSLAVTGNISGANITGAHYGAGNNLSNIQGANVTGNVTSAVTANFANFAGNVTVAAQPNITSVGTLTSVAVSGTTNLGAVGNVTITGGTTGQVLTTNGSGVLSWSSAGGVANGTSNVSIPAAAGNVNIVSSGNTTLVVTGTGANVAGTLNATGTVNIGGAYVATSTTAASAVAANCSAKNYFTYSSTGAITVSLGSVPTGVYSCTLDFVGGAGIITWTSLTGLTWAGATAPTRPASGQLLVMLVTTNGGTNWFGSSLSS